jgi:hypothetical protein
MPTCSSCRELILLGSTISYLADTARNNGKQTCKKTDSLNKAFRDHQSQSGSKAASGKAKRQSET